MEKKVGKQTQFLVGRPRVWSKKAGQSAGRIHTYSPQRWEKGQCGTAQRWLSERKRVSLYLKRKMSFVLADFIYQNLQELNSANLLTRIASCGPSAEEYVGYRLGYSARDRLHKIIKRIGRVPDGDWLLRSEDQLKGLAEALVNNPEDGMYWVVIYDEYPPGVTDHVLIIEVVGDQACLIHTYNIIGSRDVCGRRLCQIPKTELAERFMDIAQLLASDQEVILWSPEDWHEWLQLLALPQVPPPHSNLVIKHRRTQWGFVPLSSRGVLYELYHTVTDELAAMRQYGGYPTARYGKLVAIQDQIERLSMGADYLAGARPNPI